MYDFLSFWKMYKQPWQQAVKVRSAGICSAVLINLELFTDWGPVREILNETVDYR